jgi:hypothetical protein
MAYEMAEALTAEGINAIGLDGRTPTIERRRILADFQRGDVQVVCNCAVLTEGFDAPWCSAVVIARPTSSASLYVQMAGRGLRPYPGKRDAMLIDVVGVTGRHRLASLVDLSGAERVEKLDAELAAYEPDEEIDLLGLLDPASRGARRGEDVGADGTLHSEIVDLFGSSRQAWLRTGRGVWFLSAGARLIFIAPEPDPGRYAVARVPQYGGGGEFLQRDVDLDMAMSWGEQYAGEDADVLTRRGAGWRKGEPKQQQLVMAARLDVSSEGRTRGELSDAISMAVATARLDPMPCVSTVNDRGYW